MFKVKNLTLDTVYFTLSTKKDKILFAISIHEIECWLLPFNTTIPAQYSKIVGCLNALERILKPKGISLHKKNYRDGKHYDDLSRGMKNNKELMQRYSLNPSLKVFVDALSTVFPSAIAPSETVEDSGR